MKKIIISLAALAAISGTALASDRSDSSSAWRNSFNAHNTPGYTTSNDNAFAVPTNDANKLDFLTMKRLGIEPGSDNH